MTNRNEDAFIEGLFRRAAVPKGFRPRTEEGIDEMLRALGQVEVSHEEHQRVLDKILGKQPFGKAMEPDPCDFDQAEVESESEEFVEMFRGEGEDDVPPEIAERLKQLEREAAEEPNDDEVDRANGS